MAGSGRLDDPPLVDHPLETAAKVSGVVTAPEKGPIQAFEKKLEGLRSSLDAKITVTWS